MAQNAVGNCYSQGIGVDKDDAQAAAWWRKAAEQGHVESQYWLGVSLAEGRGGLAQDLTEAGAWYKKAADQGHVRARERLAELQSNKQE